MTSIYDDPEDVLATTAQLLETEGLHKALSVLKSAQASFKKTGYDNWDGGTDIYTLNLGVEPALFASLGSGREQIETQIAGRLKTVTEQYVTDWITVKINPLVIKKVDWRTDVGEIPREIRQSIFDIFRLSKYHWSGDLDEVDFLGRIFDLKALPSTDGRFQDAARDIWQHRINNPMDWDDNWVFSDKRFSLLDCPHEVFLKFLCESVHPATRRDKAACVELVQEMNKHLEECGWELIEEQYIAGRPRYDAVKIVTTVKRASHRARTVADALDAAWMHKEIMRMENSVEADPSLAIGTAKDLVESCCKTILTKLSVEFPKGTDFPALTKLTVKQLGLVPENISEASRGSDTIKRILSNLAAITHGLAEIRGLYGSGHGRDGKHKGLEARHARLAAGAAVTFIDFVTDAYHKQVNKTAEEIKKAAN